MIAAPPGITSALRLEATERYLAVDCLRGWRGAVTEDIAGGTALFGGQGSPLSQALHVGMSGPVSDEEFDRLEAFFRNRNTSITISLCPLADASLVELVGKRGYRISHFENTLARTVSPESRFDPPEARAIVRMTRPHEGPLWGATVMRGFYEGADAAPEILALFASLYDNPAGFAWLAELDGAAAGGAAMGIHEGAAMFYGDATLPEARRCGAQSALIHARLLHAQDAGCDLAIACTVPGTISQRNYERLGFRVAYTKVLMIREWS